MKLDVEAIKRQCAARGVRLSRVLRDAGISRTAYYSLVRRDSVLPKTVLKLAQSLNVPTSRILDEGAVEERRAQLRLREAKRILRRYPEAAFENVWHTLVLLEESPAARLTRALRRGRVVGV